MSIGQESENIGLMSLFGYFLIHKMGTTKPIPPTPCALDVVGSNAMEISCTMAHGGSY